MKNILLVTHDCSLSGAPKSILLVFEIMVKKGFEVSTIALKGGGKLEPRFKTLSTHYYCLEDYSNSLNYSFKNRFKKKFFNVPILSEYAFFIDSFFLQKVDVIYCNTIVSLSTGIEIKQRSNCKLILHIHELKTVIDMICPNIKDFETLIDIIIVPSNLNKKCLIEDYGISAKKIIVIRETTELPSLESKKIDFTETINVLMCGGAYWRKGDDLFILLANRLMQKDQRFRFFWVGFQSEERKMVNEADIRKLNLQSYVHFIDETEDVSSWYEQSDLFLLISREDPFPLAAIEAGMMGLPIVCFDKATGISEVIDENCVVPYLDLEAMSERILSILNDREGYMKISQNNQSVFREFNPEIIAASIIDVIRST